MALSSLAPWVSRVTIADLACRITQAGGEDAAADGPHDAGTGPGHAFEEAAAVDAVAIAVGNHAICHELFSFS